MKPDLFLYNTLTRTKEKFEPIKPPFVGMYVCGPTVYGHPHLGHARAALTFDILYRYLKFLGFKVRYVRNITDVGHLVNDADEGEDKIAKKAKTEQLEPMEVVQFYMNSYHRCMDKLNIQRPDIEPRASGHIPEQLEMVEKILENGFAYQAQGNIYFDVLKYAEKNNYGKLSGRVIDDLLATTRQLDGQKEKKNPLDFALWKNASPEHIMRWKSPWGEGFPGWHLECSVMSVKYLGEHFDIHGGGMDLLFPHHECEIAQNVAANGHETVKYWVHNNMITINNQKMGKSLGNFITLDELFEGNHQILEKAYSPMSVRFFILQAHYRSTLDFSNQALQASEKGLQRLFLAMDTLKKLKTSNSSSFNVEKLENECFEAISDDLNTSIAIAHLFDATRYINSVYAGNESITEVDKQKLINLFNTIVIDILGLQDEAESNSVNDTLKNVMQILLNLRTEAKLNKDFATSDKIRNELLKAGVLLKDRKDGSDWEIIS